MRHSQFHSKNLFILRHAWLNLWDKHMTTGRINQVTIHSHICRVRAEDDQTTNALYNLEARDFNVAESNV